MLQNFIAQSANIERKLADILGPAGLEKELSKVMSDYADMIDRRAAIYILGIEKGLVQKRKRLIESFSELTEDESSVSFRAMVQRVFVPFESKMHRTMRVLLTDGKCGEKVIVLWDAKVDEVLKQKLEEGDMLVVENAYYRGGELHAGQYSALIIDKKNKIMPLSKVVDGKCNVAVRLVGPLGVRTYVRNGAEKQMASGFVADDSGRVRTVVWNGAVEKLSNAKVGDVLRIHNAVFRNGELHINEFSDIEISPEGCIVLNRIEEVFDGIRCAFTGKIISVFEQGGWLYIVLRSESKDLKVLVKEEAVRALVGTLSPDIEASTAGLLKLKSLIGKGCIVEGRMVESGIFECIRIIEE